VQVHQQKIIGVKCSAVTRMARLSRKRARKGKHSTGLRELSVTVQVHFKPTHKAIPEKCPIAEYVSR